jgi:predicted Zn-dependent protease
VRRPARLALAAAALAICLWFGLGVRQATGLSHAEAIIGATPRALSAAQAARARGWLDEASTLNPDRQVDLARARLLLDRHRPLAARALATTVVRSEPQNLGAWVTLAQTAASDPALFRQTLSRVRALEPRLP